MNLKLELSEEIKYVIPLHQVLISFLNDVEAMAFVDWLFDIEGKERFMKWYKDNEEKYK